jgi:hypothetical protein
MKKILKYSWTFLVFFLLTAISQIGGVVYLISLWISNKINVKFRLKRLLVFFVLYVLTTFLIIPQIAPLTGREKIIKTSNLKPASILTNILNRNYVRKDMNTFLLNVSNELKRQNNEIQLRYLDACFPFFNGFPLFPHLSHNDGKKIDLSLIYQDKNGNIVNKSKSISGYGVFEEPKAGEINQTQLCKEKGYFQYDFPKYLTLGKINRDLEFSEKGTRLLILTLLKQKNLSKLFIEPHLKTRMKLNNEKIRFHGCKAVRHDDHIHVQIN